jgi:hypothetical protein
MGATTIGVVRRSSHKWAKPLQKRCYLCRTKTATGPEGRYNLGLAARQNLANLGCVSPSGLAIHRGLQPVVTTTGKGYASPSGLRRSQDIHLAISPEGWHNLCRGRRPR